MIIGQLWENYLSASVINHLGDKRSLALGQKRLEIALDNAIATILRSGAKPVLIKSDSADAKTSMTVSLNI